MTPKFKTQHRTALQGVRSSGLRLGSVVVGRERKSTDGNRTDRSCVSGMRCVSVVRSGVGSWGRSAVEGKWLPDMDLNHDKQIQSLLCYRYTIGQCGEQLNPRNQTL